MEEPSLKEKTAKGLFWIGLSNGVQIVLQAVIGLFFLRLLSTSDYGMVGYLTIFTNVAVALQEGGFRAALINRKNISHADYNAVFWFCLMLGLAFYAVLFLCAPLIARYYSQPALVPLARYVFLAVIFSCLSVAQGGYLMKNLLVKQQAVAGFVAILVSGTCGIVLAYNGFGYWAFATQNLLFSGTLMCCYWLFSPWRPSWHVSLAPIRPMFRFGCKIMLTNIFTQVNENIFTLILGRFYRADMVGNYTNANKWNSLGTNFITGMVRNVAQPVLVEADTVEGYQKKVFRKMLRFTAFLAFPALFGLSFIANEFIVLLATQKWAYSASLLQILCFGGAFVPVASLYWNLIISRGKSNVYMWGTLSLAILQLGTALLMAPYGVANMLRVYVCINIAWVGVWHYHAWRLIGLTLWEAAKDIVPFALAAAVSIAMAYFITLKISNMWFLMTAKIFVTAGLYVLIMRLSHAVVFNECVTYLMRKRRRKTN